MRKGMALVLLAVLLTACSGGPPTYRTPEAAFQAMFPDEAPAVVRELPMEKGKVLLFRTKRNPEIQVTAVEYEEQGKWRFHGYGIGGHQKVGPLSFDQADLGRFEVKHESGAISEYAKVRAFYGEVYDPRITWVEVTMPEEPIPQRAQVVAGTWAVTFPYKVGFRAVSLIKLRAGNETGELWRDDDPHTTAAQLRQKAKP